MRSCLYKARALAKCVLFVYATHMEGSVRNVCVSGLKRLLFVAAFMRCLGFAGESADVVQFRLPDCCVQVVCVLPAQTVYGATYDLRDACVFQSYDGASFSFELEQPFEDFIRDEYRKGYAFVDKNDQHAVRDKTLESDLLDTKRYKPCTFFSERLTEVLMEYHLNFFCQKGIRCEEKVCSCNLLKSMLGPLKAFRWSAVDTLCFEKALAGAEVCTNQVFVHAPGGIILRGVPQLRFLSKNAMHRRSVYRFDMEALLNEAVTLSEQQKSSCLKKCRYNQVAGAPTKLYVRRRNFWIDGRVF